MKNLVKNLFLGVALVLGLSACGSANGTVDPITLFSDSSIPKLDTIIPANSSYSMLSSGFSPSNPFWTFNNASFFGGTYIAPAKGIVSSVGTATIGSTTANYVTIVHSGRLATRVYGMQLIQVRVGDSVVSGQTIGNFISSGQVGFQVLLDGSPICPLSFMSDAFRSALNTFFIAQTCI